MSLSTILIVFLIAFVIGILLGAFERKQKHKQNIDLDEIIEEEEEDD